MRASLELFRRLDQPASDTLPRIRDQLARWKKARVNILDVEFERHYYSVPYRLVNSAGRDPLHGCEHIVPAPGPAGGLASSQPRVRSRLYLLRAPSTVSPALSGVVSFAVDLLGCQDRTPLSVIWSRRCSPLAAIRNRPTAAAWDCCGWARPSARIAWRPPAGGPWPSPHFSYQSVKSILKTGLDSQPLPETQPPQPALEHSNLRGADYFTCEENSHAH